jgi:hypothetical protein
MPHTFTPCSALVNGYCINGFMATPGCRNTECIGGVYTHVVCMSESWAARMHPETGMPSERDIARNRQAAGLPPPPHIGKAER